MKDVRAFSGREILILWAGGVGLAICLLLGARALQRPILRTEFSQLAREQLLRSERQREVDSAYAAYAHARPEDSAAQAAFRPRVPGLGGSVKSGSVTADLVRRGLIDTAFTPTRRSQRTNLVNLSGLFGTLAMYGMALAIPLVLAVVTLWWIVVRRGPPRDEMPA